MATKLFVATYNQQSRNSIIPFNGFRIFNDREQAVNVAADKIRKARENLNFTDDNVVIENDSEFVAFNELYSFSLSISDYVLDNDGKEFLAKAQLEKIPGVIPKDADDIW